METIWHLSSAQWMVEAMVDHYNDPMWKEERNF